MLIFPLWLRLNWFYLQILCILVAVNLRHSALICDSILFRLPFPHPIICFAKSVHGCCEAVVVSILGARWAFNSSTMIRLSLSGHPSLETAQFAAY